MRITWTKRPPREAPTNVSPRVGPALPRALKWAFIGVFSVGAVIAFWASLDFQAAFARDYGWPGKRAYMWPLMVDTLAVGSWLVAVVCREVWVKVWGAAAAGASIAGNIIGHGMAADSFHWRVVFSSAAPPIIMCGLVQLWFYMFPVALLPAQIEANAEASPVEVPVPAPTLTSSAAAPPAALADVSDAAPGSALASGPAAPTSEPVSRDAGTGTPGAVGAADSPLEDLPVALAAWAASVPDDQLAADARRREAASVRGLRNTYGVSDSRARRVAGLAREGVTA